MHDYSIDKHPKEKILFLLAAVAITFAPILQDYSACLVTWLELHELWSSAPVIAVPVFGVFAGLYYLFDRYLWKLPWLRRILLVPDLNGTWSCEGKTALKNGERADFEWQAAVSITQSWSKLRIYLQTAQSESESISASVFHEDGVGYRVFYQYNNRPNADELDLNNHSGSVELLFSESLDSARGSYFTDRHRTTVGTMKLHREG